MTTNECWSTKLGKWYSVETTMGTRNTWRSRLVSIRPPKPEPPMPETTIFLAKGHSGGIWMAARSAITWAHWAGKASMEAWILKESWWAWVWMAAVETDRLCRMDLSSESPVWPRFWTCWGSGL